MVRSVARPHVASELGAARLGPGFRFLPCASTLLGMFTSRTDYHRLQPLVLLTAGGAANNHVPAATARVGLDPWARAWSSDTLTAGTVRG
jgi:hypothetical protein